MQIQCGACGKTLSVDDKLAGKKVKCPCGAIVDVVPATSAKPLPAKPQPAKPQPARPPAPGPAAPGPPAPVTGGGGAFDFGKDEVASLFGELTDNDMVVKGPSTTTKPKKTKDPLAAYEDQSVKKKKPAPAAKSSAKPQATPASVPGAPKPKMNRGLLIALIIGGVVAVGGMGGAFYFLFLS